jgi:ubiquinone/menaquinone biosynthesis C-methylase UbiE
MPSGCVPGRAVPSDATAKILAQEYVSKPMHALCRSYDFAACDLVPLEIKQPVLDLGCGNGAFGSVFCRIMGLSCLDLGLDLNRKAVQQAGRRCLYKLVLCSDARSLPIKSGAIRFLLCSSALQAIGSRHDMALLEAARVLAPGGQLLMTVPTPSFTVALLPTRFLVRLGLHRLARLYGDRVNKRGGHRRLEFLDFWRRELAQVGLKIEHDVHYFSSHQAAWWSLMAMRPFQLFALLNYVPSFLRNSAIFLLERFLRFIPRLASSDEKGMGYLLIVAQKI